MASDEDGYGRGELGADEGHNVRDDLGRRAREAMKSGLHGAATPAPLVKAVCCDAEIGEIWEESVVAIDVIIETMDKDELGLGLAVGLRNNGKPEQELERGRQSLPAMF